MFGKMKLGTKVLLAFLVVGIIPFAIIATISFFKTSGALSQRVFGQLESVTAIKKGQLEARLARRKGDIVSLAETVSTFRREASSQLEAVSAIKAIQLRSYFARRVADLGAMLRDGEVSAASDRLEALQRAAGTSRTGGYDVESGAYKAVYEQVDPLFQGVRETYGYEDIYLLGKTHGHVMYSAIRKEDLGANLSTGKYKDSALAQLWAKVVREKKVCFQDLALYAPGGNRPAMFLGGPVLDGNADLKAVLVLQLDLKEINKIMHERTGMGETGKTYLVGPDLRMRSDSVLDPVNHSVAASLEGSVEKNGADTEASREALAGQTGQKVMQDYRGIPVLSCFAPVKVGDTTWALIGEMDVAEALCPRDETGTYFYDRFVQIYGYGDLMLMNPDGYCFYSVSKGSDFQTNLINGKYRQTNLGKLIRQVASTKQFGFADFALYEPSGGKPAAFMSMPVLFHDSVVLFVALQLSLNDINRIMNERSGMGETGETYLVGGDNLMRSDSIKDRTYHTVEASFANPEKGKVDTLATKEALAGKAGMQILQGYLGVPVLAAYTPVDVYGQTWALLSVVDEKEAFSTVSSLKWLFVVFSIIALGAVIAVALLITRSIVRPINRVIDGLAEGSRQVASASGQVSNSSQQMAQGANEQASSLEEISSSVEELTSMTKQNADNAEDASKLATQIVGNVKSADQAMNGVAEAMGKIQEASNKTSAIIKTIDNIAFQTNLLALNAAVEAARAGEAGRGFAVVAEEVRNLALRSSNAAKDTATLIEDSLSKSAEGITVSGKANEIISAISGTIDRMSLLITEVATASNEQARGIRQINTGVTQMDQVTQSNAANAEESASASEELSVKAQELYSMVDALTRLVTGEVGRDGRAPGPRQQGRDDTRRTGRAGPARALRGLHQKVKELLEHEGPEEKKGAGEGAKHAENVAKPNGGREQKTASQRHRERTEAVFSLEDDDMKDF